MQYAIIIAHFQCKSSISKHLRYEIFHAQCDPLETLYIHVDIIVFLYFCALYFHTYFYRNRPFVLELSNIRPKAFPLRHSEYSGNALLVHILQQANIIQTASAGAGLPLSHCFQFPISACCQQKQTI